MKKLALLLLCSLSLFAQKKNMLIPYEKGNGNQTATYAEVIEWFTQLDKQYEDRKSVV